MKQRFFSSNNNNKSNIPKTILAGEGPPPPERGTGDADALLRSAAPKITNSKLKAIVFDMSVLVLHNPETGDPNGIGFEIILKTFEDKRIFDFFTPIVDEPYAFGQIAAANSLSDIYAMGGKPLFALNIVGFPINELPKSVLTEILQGGADKAKEAGKEAKREAKRAAAQAAEVLVQLGIE